MQYSEIIDFWFEEITAKSWWQKNPAFDQQIKKRFSHYHSAARQCELYNWRESPVGRLAEIIILDQFSRNIFRDTPNAFAQDALALCLAQAAVELNSDRTLEPRYKAFLYMPYMHSESKQIHQIAAVLYDQPGLENNLDFELKHKVIIDRFNRYPHRNAILGRNSSTEEIAFLQEANSSF